MWSCETSERSADDWIPPVSTADQSNRGTGYGPANFSVCHPAGQVFCVAGTQFHLDPMASKQSHLSSRAPLSVRYDRLRSKCDNHGSDRSRRGVGYNFGEAEAIHDEQ